MNNEIKTKLIRSPEGHLICEVAYSEQVWKIRVKRKSEFITLTFLPNGDMFLKDDRKQTVFPCDN